jgi:hypothetical protein
MSLMNEDSEQLVDFLRRENLVLVRRDRWGKVLGDEQAVYRVRMVCENEATSDGVFVLRSDVLAALRSNPS